MFIGSETMKTPMTKLNLALWLVALVFSFILGGKFFPRETIDSQRPQEIAAESETSGAKKSTSHYVSESLSPTPTVSVKAFKDEVRRALYQSDMTEQQIMLFRAFEDLNHHNLNSAIAAVEELPKGVGKTVASMILMRSWASFDPEGAITYSRNNLGGQIGKIAANEAMRAWAGRDPASALSWIQASNRVEDQNELMSGLILGWGSYSLGEATTFAQNIADSRLRERSIGQIANQALAHGPDAMKSWVDSLENSRDKEIAMSMIAKQWGAMSPTDAAEWLKVHASEDYASGAVSNLVDRWSRNNPAKVAEWIQTMPDGKSKQEGTVALLNRWIETDPVSAGDFLNNQPPGPGLDKAIDRYAQDSAEDDPAIAITWADSIFDSEMRRSSVIDVARKWNQVDPQAAEKWMQDQQLPNDMLEAIRTPSEERQKELRKWMERRSRRTHEAELSQNM